MVASGDLIAEFWKSEMQKLEKMLSEFIDLVGSFELEDNERMSFMLVDW